MSHNCGPIHDPAFELCLDIADPAQPLVLYQDDGPQVWIGAPAGNPGGGADHADPKAVLARVLTSEPDPECAEPAVSPGMSRYQMTVELPFAVSGEAKLALRGTRATYYIVNFSRPNLFVLAVGINEYQDGRWQLNYAVNDANAFARLVTETQVQIYENIDVTVLTDKKATRSRILRELANIQRKAKSSDWVAIFFAGHALADRLYNYYFLPWDYDDAYPHAVHISEHDLSAHLRGIRGKKLLVLDTCYAGNLAQRATMHMPGGGRERGKRDPNRLPLASVRAYAERLMALDDGLVLLAASSLDQTAREANDLRHGVFTSTLLDALRSPEQFGNRQYPGALSLADIRDWVEEEVVRRSRDRQRPVISGRSDLMRAPFWQVSPTTYAGRKDAQSRGGVGAGSGIGEVLWHAGPVTPMREVRLRNRGQR